MYRSARRFIGSVPRFTAVVVVALSSAGAPAVAQKYPDRPVKIVAPFAPGGGVDLAARLVAEKLQPILGQPVIVENKPGAGAMIGAEAVAKAAPDGYTLLLTSNSLVNSPVLFGRAPFDWRKDFAFVSTILTQPMALIAHPALPAASVQELIALAKKDGGKLSMATASAGSINHLAGELVLQSTGARWEMVHYKGSAPATADLVGGQVQLQFDQLAAALPHIRAGKVKALAVTSLSRAPSLPDVPTMDEAGLKGFEAITLFGLIAPARTPPEVVAALGAAMEKVLKDPAVVERFAAMGSQAVYSTPEGLRDALVKQAETWTTVIQRANIKLD
ncbi:MAG: tripartite tricarboxylate transporter substrate binding protein [Rhodospirillales bacterium]|nr:tripartite tricarboxylate transporter substrate binding protein [Rhodospirillales bacterium]